MITEIYDFIKLMPPIFWYVVLAYPVLYIFLNFFEAVLHWSTQSYEIITVTHKERIYHKGNSEYIIYTEQGVFKNVDAWYFLKWNSSNLYEELKPKETYKVNISGIRMPLFSDYRNIIKIKYKIPR